MSTRDRRKPTRAALAKEAVSKYKYSDLMYLLDFDYEVYRYYFFTIKHNHSVALFDRAHDYVKLISYIGSILQSSYIECMTYAFELDSQKRLHVHGVAASMFPLRYSNLYRCWGVHHHFKEIMKPKGTPYESSVPSMPIVWYILKNPIGPVIKSFKQNEDDNTISNLAYWSEHYKEV